MYVYKNQTINRIESVQYKWQTLKNRNINFIRKIFIFAQVFLPTPTSQPIPCVCTRSRVVACVRAYRSYSFFFFTSFERSRTWTITFGAESFKLPKAFAETLSGYYFGAYTKRLCIIHLDSTAVSVFPRV